VPIDRMQLPCWTCTRPEAAEVRYWLGSCSDEDIETQRSPSGWPLGCCHVRVVGVVPGSDTTRAEM
jgi:hypothetical protein